MKVITVANAGFCFGVKRAINIAFQSARDSKEGIYTLGPIIHNPQVVKKLADEGVRSVEDLDKEDIGKLIIRSHGVPTDVIEEASEKGIEIIDATCPFVKNAQKYAHLLGKEGYQVIIVGDRDHPEVKSILSYAGDRAVVVNRASLIDEIPLNDRVGIIAQTTQRHSIFQEVVLKCFEKAKEVKVYDTICNSTTTRQDETKRLAGEVDIVIVVGGKCSANTTQLATICKQMGTRTFHIEVPEEIEEDWFYGMEKVGVTAGASTPGWIIDSVIERIHDIDKKLSERRGV
ncbi:MAG: 4-hydroxy-3-methylbut-2-enyl diphosphate reductase [Nitrospirota bacterium]